MLSLKITLFGVNNANVSFIVGIGQPINSWNFCRVAGLSVIRVSFCTVSLLFYLTLFYFGNTFSCYLTSMQGSQGFDVLANGKNAGHYSGLSRLQRLLSYRAGCSKFAS